MRILDIDLDFFLDKIAINKPYDDNRLDGRHYHPWSREQVEIFLEKHCGLSKQRKIPGQCFKHHDEVFYHVRQLIIDKSIIGAVDLVHVDAHSDFSNGLDSSYIYIMDDLLNYKDFNERYFPKKMDLWTKMNAGNFLLYMLAARMIKKLTFVKHVDCHDNIYKLFFKNNDPSTEVLQLKSYGPGQVREAIQCFRDILDETTYKSTSYEPEVPYRSVVGLNYFTKESFDQLLLTRSPSYTPKESDELIPVIEEYMQY